MEKILKQVEYVLSLHEFDLVDIKFQDVGATWSLRIFIDKPGGITVEDCARVSREVSDRLDAEDLIAHKYLLEISSPGLDRPLKTRDDFRRKIGTEVKLFLKQNLLGSKEIEGEIVRLEEEKLILKTGGKETSLPFANIIEGKTIF